MRIAPTTKSYHPGALSHWSVLALFVLLIWFAAALLNNANSLSWSRYDLLRLALVSIATLALCILPGLALILTCWPDAPLTWPERLALSWGIGAGLPPLLLMVMHLLQLPWPVWMSFAYVIAAGLALIGLLIRRSSQGSGVRDQGAGDTRQKTVGLKQATRATAKQTTDYLLQPKANSKTRDTRQKDLGSLSGKNHTSEATGMIAGDVAPSPPHPLTPSPPHPFTPAAPPLHSALLIGLTLMALFIRLVMIRNISVGPYVDSYHHTLIAQLLVEHRGLFTTWEPYAPLSTFTYHYGFHSIVAWVHDLTTLPVWQLEPIVAQVLAAGIVPLMALLTFRLTANRWAGIWAALLVGFVNNQPAYYLVWGRSTSLTSHVILCALIVCWLAAIEAPRLRPGLIVLTTLCCAGLAYTHYQTALIAVIYLSIYMAILVLRAPTTRAALPELGRAMLIGLAALILVTPWIMNTIAGELDRNVSYNSDRQSSTAFAGLIMPRLTPFYLHPLILPLAIIALMIGLRMRRWRIVMIGGWVLASMIVAFPYVFSLPGTGVLEPNFMALMLYLCMIPLAAYPIGILHERAASALKAQGSAALLAGLAHAAAILIIIAISIWAMGWQRDLLPAEHRMVTAADMQAFEWIHNNTPSNARFYVQNHPLYGGTMIVGTDAGWWIPLLAGRQTNVPPMTYGSEQSSPRNWGDQLNKLAATIRRAPLSNAQALGIDLSRTESLKALEQAQIDYVYIGAQPLIGDKGFGAIDRIDVEKLRRSADMRLIYEKDGVLIFEIIANRHSTKPLPISSRAYTLSVFEPSLRASGQAAERYFSFSVVFFSSFAGKKHY